MQRTPERSPSIRLRLSNERDHAVEFTAQDAPSLARGVDRAERQYAREQGAENARLVLQIRPAELSGGWFVPVRDGLPVVVSVTRELIERRPPDDWTEIWQWCVDARVMDRGISQLAREASDDATSE